MRISPQRAGNDPTPETRTGVDSADHRATVLLSSISRRLRRIVRKTGGSSSPLPDRGGLDSQVATEPADRLLSVGRPRHAPSWYAPIPSPRRRSIQRVAMSVFESCGKQTENPGELCHPNCNLRSATTNSRKACPNTGAPAHCTLTCRNASVKSILLNTSRARGPKRRRKCKMRQMTFRTRDPTLRREAARNPGQR